MQTKRIAVFAAAMLALQAAMPLEVSAASASDVRHLVKTLTTNGAMTKADDFNGDGLVNAVDLTLMKRAILAEAQADTGEVKDQTVTAITEQTKLIGRTMTKDGVTWLVHSGSAVECTVTGVEASVTIEGYDSDYPETVRNERLLSCRHRYLPVYKRTPDAIEGVIDTMTGEIEDALFVPEAVTLDDLLVTFRKSKKPMAIVIDEFGGTAGIITLNDVMEIIMGPGVFGKSDEEPSLVRKTRNTWVIDGRASLDEINRELGVELEAEDADRLSGWVAFHAERIPHVGQQIEAQGCRATILKRRKHRVTSVKLEVLAYPETDSDEELLAETDEAVEKTEEENR